MIFIERPDHCLHFHCTVYFLLRHDTCIFTDIYFHFGDCFFIFL
uniref:Uncharacterized protein n=1 Tax=Anguilla anguilla TaxID=7936 RepID=A0A0E9PJX2_ANGAN